jgi:hypothetical protein
MAKEVDCRQESLQEDEDVPEQFFGDSPTEKTAAMRAVFAGDEPDNTVGYSVE